MAGERILVVDDDTAVCKLIARVVASKGMAPFSAGSGEEALDMLQEDHFDLMVLDIKMGGIDGFEVVETVRARQKDIPIIILSGNSESYNKLLGLEIGADDYITKPFDPAFLAAKIQALIRRDQKARVQNALKFGSLTYDPSTMKLQRHGRDIPLSGKEHALLRALLENRGKAFSKEELYEKVWGEPNVDESAIMVYISRLRGKIEDDPKKPKFIQTVWGAGYKFSDDS